MEKYEIHGSLGAHRATARKGQFVIEFNVPEIYIPDAITAMMLADKSLYVALQEGDGPDKRNIRLAPGFLNGHRGDRHNAIILQYVLEEARCNFTIADLYSYKEKEIKLILIDITASPAEAKYVPAGEGENEE